MDKRRETPDILGDLLGGEPSSGPASQETVKPAERPAVKPARRQASKTARPKASRPAEEPEPEAGKVKATYYLGLETLDGLEEGWLQLRRLTGREQRTSISKSLILETALQIALEELEQAGRESKLASRILKQ
jgi:hypothetical protein